MADVNTVCLGDVEEGSDGDFAAAVAEAVGILAVGFIVVVIRIEVAESVEDGTAIFPELSHESEGNGQPFRVSGRDVDAGGFDITHDSEDGREIGRRSHGWRKCSRHFLHRGGVPIVGIEGGLFHSNEGLR